MTKKPSSSDKPTSQTQSQKKAAYWLSEVKMYEADAKEFVSRGKKIIKRYRDERPDKGGVADGTRKMNILWSNVQTMQPAVYGRTPQPIVERRFHDKDPVGRAGATILERALRYEMDPSGFHDTACRTTLDYLLSGRGTAWIRYTPKMGDPISVAPSGDDELLDEATGEPLESQEPEGEEYEVEWDCLTVDYINWQDFLHSRARTWTEVQWVAKRVYMSREDLTERFGDKIGKRIPLTCSPLGKEKFSDDASKGDNAEATQAVVYEIWCKYDKTVYWIAMEFDDLLDQKEDPLKLDDFFPCPSPLYATQTNETLFPVADFVEYQDQAAEIDSLTDRISKLSKALKAAGVYAAGVTSLSRLLEEGSDNQMFPVDQWAMFAEKGGLAGIMSFLPIKEIAEVLVRLTEARNTAKQDLYEITGIADIIRGQTDPNETMGAQQIKSNYAALRLKARQDDVARFCRDIISIMGEIIAEHYDPATLIQVSGAMLDEGLVPTMPSNPMAATGQGAPMGGQPPGMVPPAGQPIQVPPNGMAASSAGPIPPTVPAPGGPVQPGGAPQAGPPTQPMPGGQMPPMPPPIDPMLQQQMEQQWRQDFVTKAIEMLRDDKLRGFRIDVETDSTVQGDQQQEQQQVTEFLTATVKYMETAAMIGPQVPEMIPLLVKMLQFGVRRFSVGRDLETAFDDFADKMETKAKQAAANPQQKPDPEAMKAQAEILKVKLEAESEQTNAQMMLQGKQMDMQIKQFEAQAKSQQLQQQAEYDAMLHSHRMSELSLTPKPMNGGGDA